MQYPYLWLQLQLIKSELRDAYYARQVLGKGLLWISKLICLQSRAAVFWGTGPSRGSWFYRGSWNSHVDCLEWECPAPSSRNDPLPHRYCDAFILTPVLAKSGFVLKAIPCYSKYMLWLGYQFTRWGYMMENVTKCVEFHARGGVMARSSLQVYHRGWGGKIYCFRVVLFTLIPSYVRASDVHESLQVYHGGNIYTAFVLCWCGSRSYPLVFTRLMFTLHLNCCDFKCIFCIYKKQARKDSEGGKNYAAFYKHHVSTQFSCKVQAFRGAGPLFCSRSMPFCRCASSNCSANQELGILSILLMSFLVNQTVCRYAGCQAAYIIPSRLRESGGIASPVKHPVCPYVTLDSEHPEWNINMFLIVKSIQNLKLWLSSPQR